MRIYLAGGMRSGWQDRVVEESPRHTYRDPRQHELPAAEHYTAWDLQAIRCSDALFGYLEADNPSGVGLALEVGYAAGWGLLTILVDDGEHGRYFDLVRATCDVRCADIDEGIRLLRALEKMPGGAERRPHATRQAEALVRYRDDPRFHQLVDQLASLQMHAGPFGRADIEDAARVAERVVLRQTLREAPW